jgi:hypothetical protein
MSVSHWEIYLICIFGGIGRASYVCALNIFRVCRIGRNCCILFVLKKTASLW